MALPPTQLTALLGRAATGDDAVRTLAAARCLRAGVDLAVVARIVDDARARVAAMPPGWCGPSAADMAAAALAEAGLLSEAGERARCSSPVTLDYDASRSTPAPWWARSRLLVLIATALGWLSLCLALFATLPFFGSELDVSLVGRGARTSIDRLLWLAIYATVAAACGIFLVASWRRLRASQADDGPLA